MGWYTLALVYFITAGFYADKHEWLGTILDILIGVTFLAYGRAKELGKL